MEINGLPLHALVVHATVVFVPLAALGAILYAVPKWRWLLRWPTLLVNLAAAVLVQISMMSGRTSSRPGTWRLRRCTPTRSGPRSCASPCSCSRVVVIVAFWALGYVTRLAGGADREARVPALEKPLMVLLVVAGVAVLVLVFLTGDAGARAVWG